MSAKLKPRRMVAMTDPHFYVLNKGEYMLKMRSNGDTVPDYVPVLVIPLTPECVAALNLKARKWAVDNPDAPTSIYDIIEQTIHAIGIRAPKKGRK